MIKKIILLAFVFSGLICTAKDSVNTYGSTDSIPGVRKLRDLVIYEDSIFYSSFPSVIKRPDGELMVAFRRAPDRQVVFGEEATWHVDPNSYLTAVRSRDNGYSWTRNPQIFYAHPFGGSQDPCMLQLRDGTLLCFSYGWASVRPNGFSGLKELNEKNRYGSVSLGGYYIRSYDGGVSWEGPFYPPSLPGSDDKNPMNHPKPVLNRGALCEGSNGDLYWVVAGRTTKNPGKTSIHLFISRDKGVTWEYSTEVASHSDFSFNETSIYETPKGDLVAFIRTADMKDQACIARSTDGGKSFHQWESMNFQGHPLQATRLPDDRVLLVYGYRHKPYGIRARILNPECTDYKTAPEIILREDGGTWDIGYPWSVVLDDTRVLVTYYFNQDDGTRFIAGSILEIK